MPDYRSMFERLYLGCWDLQGKDCTVRISRVVVVTLTAQGGRKSDKPVIYMHGTKKGLVLNKTNARTIAALYGPDTDDWVNQRVTLYPTKCQMGNETVDAIRIRGTVPADGQKPQAIESQPVDRGMRERQNIAAAQLEGTPYVDADGVVLDHPPESPEPKGNEAMMRKFMAELRKAATALDLARISAEVTKAKNAGHITDAQRAKVKKVYDEVLAKFEERATDVDEGREVVAEAEAGE